MKALLEWVGLIILGFCFSLALAALALRWLV